MNAPPPSYVWSDAWLLTAIYGASLEGETTLARVIGLGDFSNHSIFTLSELNGGLSRLQRGGLIRIETGHYPLTPEGRAMTQMESGQRVGPFKHIEQVRKRLAALDWTPGADPNAVDDSIDQPVHVTDESFRKAFDEYRTSLKKRPRKKKGEPDAAPNRRPPRQLPTSPEIQSSDSQRTPSSGGCE
ncbi:MAG: hypothetical protein ACYDH9_21550 [Limisphaerales bacterium]